MNKNINKTMMTFNCLRFTTIVIKIRQLTVTTNLY